MVRALAGTGKTSTMAWALTGKAPKGITLSDEQTDILKVMRKMDRKEVMFMAFNNSIVDTAKKMVPAWVETRTCNAFAYRAWYEQLDKRPAVDRFKTAKIFRDVVKSMSFKERMKLEPTVVRLVALMKGTMTYPDNPGDVIEMAEMYGIDYTTQEIEYACDVFDRGIEQRDVFDFDDQFFMPLHYDIDVTPRSTVVVDEAQDLNIAKQRMALKFAEGGSLVVVGDPNQSIYGFAGADPESMPRLQRLVKGMKVLPLTITRRCPHAVVAQANRWVPDLRAADDAPEGEVIYSTFQEFVGSAIKDKETDRMILCRVNAPLLGLTFKFLSQDRRAFIQGRDIGEGIVSQTRKLDPYDVNDLVRKFDESTERLIQREQAKNFPDDNKMEMWQDRNQCVQMIASRVDSVGEFEGLTKELFKDSGRDGDIRLSSVHRAKGLEADHVTIYMPEILPYKKFMQGMQAQQERNLAYVADTRSKNILEYASAPDREAE